MDNRTALFIKEPGRAKEIRLELTAPLPALKKLKAGDILDFKSEDGRLLVTNDKSAELGEMEPGDLKEKIQWALQKNKEVFAVVLDREKKKVGLLIKTDAPLFKDDPEESGDLRLFAETGASALEEENTAAPEEKEESGEAA